MEFTPTAIPDVVLIHPQVFGDERGFFMETYRAKVFGAAGLPDHFVQDNHSGSRQGTLRGLHYQIRQAQGKLVRVVAGEVFDVAVDLRRCSPTFGKWVGVSLSAQNKLQLWIPPALPTAFTCSASGLRLSTKPPIIMPRNGSAPCCGMIRSSAFPGLSCRANSPSSRQGCSGKCLDEAELYD